MAVTAEFRVAGILLAAGASRRMGANKLLLEFEGEPLVRRACRRALAAGLDPLIVVLGPEAGRMRAALQDLRCQFVMSMRIGGPISSSVHAGLLQVPAFADAAVILLADMPHVTGDMIGALIRAASQSASPLAVSDYAGVTAPPILFRRGLFAELMNCTGEGVGRTVVQRHLADALILKWPAQALGDIDTPRQFSDLGRR